MISYKELIKFIGKYKGVKLNKSLLNDIDKTTKKVIAINTSENKIKKIRKAEKELTSYYKKRIDDAQKERLTLNEFEKLEGKIFDKKARDKIKDTRERKSRLFRKYTKDFKDLKQEKRFKKALKERVWATSRLIRDDTTANEVYRYVIGGLTSKIDGFDSKDLKRIQKGIDKRVKEDKSFERIMESQKALLRASMDEIRDEIIGAIAFRWETNVDERVVGNPKGLYPYPTDIYAHGDHWEREGKLYFYPNSSAIRRGFINTSSPTYRSVESLKDGRPAQPYNCRCWSHSVSLLSEVYEYDESLLTQKGIEYLKSHKII